MDEEVERHRLIRNSLEHELQALRDRLSKVDNFADIVYSVNSNAEQTEELISRSRPLFAFLLRFLVSSAAFLLDIQKVVLMQANAQ